MSCEIRDSIIDTLIIWHEDGVLTVQDGMVLAPNGKLYKGDNSDMVDLHNDTLAYVKEQHQLYEQKYKEFLKKNNLKETIVTDFIRGEHKAFVNTKTYHIIEPEEIDGDFQEWLLKNPLHLVEPDKA